MLQNNIDHFLQITKSKLQQMNYSPNTATSYLHYLNEFLSSLNCSPSKLSNKLLENYLVNYNYSSVSKQNQIISSLKFFWVRVLGKKRLRVDFKRPRKEKKLPRVIDKDFLITRIKSIKNLKHRAIIQLGYSTGMRVSEVINLKIEDIDSARGIINIRSGKGRKDRIVPLSDSTLNLLREYFKEYRPTKYLFNGVGSDRYSRSSCGKIVKKYLRKDSHYHLLRHSFATSLVESGVNISVLQSLLGHSNPKTSAVYTHISKNLISNVVTPI